MMIEDGLMFYPSLLNCLTNLLIVYGFIGLEILWYSLIYQIDQDMTFEFF